VARVIHRHVRGAFTGAVGERNGAFRNAAQGTLFLGEVGDMDFAMQAKILRALQEHTVKPVGSVANLIVAQRARAHGVIIGFCKYFKIGAPLTVLTILFGVW